MKKGQMASLFAVLLVAAVGTFMLLQDASMTAQVLNVPGVSGGNKLVQQVRIPPLPCTRAGEVPVLNSLCCGGNHVDRTGKCMPPLPPPLDCSKQGEQRSLYGICCENAGVDAHGTCVACSSTGVPAVSNNNICCEGLRVGRDGVCRPDCARHGEWKQLHHDRCCPEWEPDDNGRCVW